MSDSCVIKTLAAFKFLHVCRIGYRLQFMSLGGVAISEFGMLTYSGEPDDGALTEIWMGDSRSKKVVFNAATDCSVKTLEYPLSLPADQPVRLFYRAYALLADGGIVYGCVKYYDFQASTKPSIETLEASLSGAGEEMIVVEGRLRFSQVGRAAVYRYGLLFLWGDLCQTRTPQFPIDEEVTEAFEKSMTALDVDVAVKSKSISLYRPARPQRLFYRAYAIVDDDIVYGEVRSVAFSLTDTDDRRSY